LRTKKQGFEQVRTASCRKRRKKRRRRRRKGGV
jgi:hypothetical protein